MRRSDVKFEWLLVYVCVSAHLYVSSVVVCVFDVREPVSGRFGKVLGLCDEPQQLGPTCGDTCDAWRAYSQSLNTQRDACLFVCLFTTWMKEKVKEQQQRKQRDSHTFYKHLTFISDLWTITEAGVYTLISSFHHFLFLSCSHYVQAAPSPTGTHSGLCNPALTDASHSHLWTVGSLLLHFWADPYGTHHWSAPR